MGSEMCIRDSTWLDRENLQCAMDSFDVFFVFAGRDCSADGAARLGVSTEAERRVCLETRLREILGVFDAEVEALREKLVSGA